MRGVVLVDADRPLRFDPVAVRDLHYRVAGRAPAAAGRMALGGGLHRRTELEAARERLRRRMRDTEAEIAADRSAQGWLTVIDGVLHNSRRTRTLPAIGYVTTHYRPLLATAACSRR